MSKKDIQTIFHSRLVWGRLFICAGLVLSGCKTGPSPIPAWMRQAERAGVYDSQAGPYARVSPLELNPNLTDEQLNKMYLPLSEIPLAADPNIVILLAKAEAAPNQTTGCNPEARKNYLQGRWLIRKALYEKAIDVLSQGLQSDPNSTGLEKLLAESYFEIGNQPAAIEACKKVLRADPDNMDAYQMLGNAYLGRSEHGRASWFYTRALACPGATRDNPMTTLVRLSLAGTLLEQGYYSASAGQYYLVYKLLLEQGKYSQANPLMKDFVRQLHLPLLTQANICVLMGQMDTAVTVLQEARQLLPEDVDLITAFALSLTKQRKSIRQRYNEITVFCRYLLTVAQDKEEVLDLFYEACQKMSKLETYPQELYGWYKPKNFRDPLLSSREYAVGLSFCGENQKAREILNQLIAKKQNLALVYLDRARLNGREQRWQDMIGDYGFVLEHDPESLDMILVEMNTIWENVPELSEQIQVWKESQDGTFSYGTSFLIGHLLNSAKENEAAEKYYRQTMDTNPDFSQGRLHLIELLLQNQKYEEILQWAGENGWDNPRLISLVARAYTGLGQYTEAEKQYRRLIELNRDDIDAYLALGENLYKQLAHPRAEEVLLYVLNNWPGREEVYQQLLKLYADWSVQSNIDEQFRLRAETRAREMLARWLDYKADSRQRKTPFAQAKESDPISDVISTLEGLARQYPHGRIIGILLSELYASVNQLDEAVLEIERISGYYPDDEEILTLAAELNERAGHLNLAAELRYRIWQQNPEKPKLLAMALQTMRQAGAYDRALEILVTAVKERPWSNVESDEEKEAEPVFEEARPALPARRFSLDAIQLLQPEALRLFVITRQYQQAVDFFEVWQHELTAAENQESHDPDQQKILEATHEIITENLIWALIESGRFDQAKEEIEGFYLQDSTKDFAMALYLVRAWNIRLDYKKSIELLQLLIEHHPENTMLRLNLAMTMIDNGRAEEAIQSAREWLKASPESKERHRLLVLVLRRAKAYEAAAEEVHLWIAAEPDQSRYPLQLADILLDAGMLDEAEKILLKRRQGSSSAEDWLEMQLKLEIARDSLDGALYLVDEHAGKENPMGLQYLKAKLYASFGQTEKALELLQKIITQDPQNIDIKLEYSIYLQRTGRNDEAIQVLEELLQSNPDNASIKNNLGYILIEENYEIERAELLLKESLQTDPQSAPTLDSVGWWYYKTGRFEIALEYIYQSAARMIRVDSEVLDHLGDTLYRLNREKEAAVYWQMALEELESRIRSEKYLVNNKNLLENKLHNIQQGIEPEISPLFAKEPLGDSK